MADHPQNTQMFTFKMADDKPKKPKGQRKRPRVAKSSTCIGAKLVKDSENTEPMAIVVERPTHRTAIVSWTSAPSASTYMVTVKDPHCMQAEWMFHTGSCSIDLPVPLEPGHSYTVTVQAQHRHYTEGVMLHQTVLQACLNFRAEFTPTELHDLLSKAIEFIRPHQGKIVMDPVVWLYRNKPKPYYDAIYTTAGGVMKVYTKDNNGDPASIINGRIKGLFFATHIDRKTKKPPAISVFGELRLLVPAPALLCVPTARFYFADFYCTFQQHYVTVVVTLRDSVTDRFCREHLIELDPCQNDFLVRRGSEVFVTRRVHVELLYTEDVDIPRLEQMGAFREVVPSRGKSTPGGLPKNSTCTACNLYPARTETEGAPSSIFEKSLAMGTPFFIPSHPFKKSLRI